MEFFQGGIELTRTYLQPQPLLFLVLVVFEEFCVLLLEDAVFVEFAEAFLF